MKKTIIFVIMLLISGLFVNMVPVSAFSKEINDFDRIWYDSDLGFNKNGNGQLVLAVTYSNATPDNPNFRNVDYAYIEFTQDPFYFSITFKDELKIIRDPEGNIIYQEPEDGYVYLRKTFVDNYLPDDIKRLASKNLKYNTITFQGIDWYRVYVPNFNRNYEWKKYTEPDLNEKWYTWGSNESILFETRAMFIEQTQETTGHLEFDFTHPSDNSGQQVVISKTYLASKGITNPVFEWGEVKPWKPIGYTENATHYFIEPEHFSAIGVHEASSGTTLGHITSGTNTTDSLNLRPNANGDVIQMTVAGASTHYEAVNEEIADDGDYVEAFDPFGATEYNLFQCDNHTNKYIIYNITQIKVYGRVRFTQNYPATRVYLGVKVNGTEDWSSAIDADYYWGVYSNTWTTNPHTSSPWTWTNLTDLQIGVKGYSTGNDKTRCSHLYVEIGFTVESFTVTRVAGSETEKNNFTFYPSENYNNPFNLRIPVSTSVQGIIDVTNNSGGSSATEVNSTEELVNNTFWYDATNQFIYIRTINITTSALINWTINCSYGANFNLIIPPYLEVGQYFHSEGLISDSDGNAISGMIAETRLLFANGTDVLSVNPKHNCTGGNYKCTFSTAVLPPGIYSVSIEFTDPTSSIVFKEGSTLYLSFATPDGVYSDALVYFSFYNTNIGLGLIPETFKVYVNGVRNYLNMHYGYTGETINITIRDYYDFVMYTSDYTITQTYTGLNFGLTFHEYDFTNANDEYFYASFLKDGATRWYERVVASSGGQKSFMLPSGNYTVRVYNADNSTYLSWTETINRSKAYLIGTDGVSLIIQGQSVIMGEFLELNEDLAYAFMPDVTIISRNPPMIYSVYDKEGMAFGNDFYMICPPLITIATTRVTQYGNWINSTPMVPGNGSVLNGTVTILRDVLYLSGPGSITWVNITYTNNDTLLQNTSYIPSRIDIYGQNLTINASGNLSVLRVTKFNQERKFDWTYYPGEGYGHEENRAGFHTAGIEIINPMSVPLYEVYAIAGFSPKSNPDGSSVEIRDTTNGGVILERGPDYDVTDTSVHFNLLSLNALETRAFTIGYYREELESYLYDEAIVSIPTYEQTVWNGDSYNFFSAHWNNLYDRTFRGALYIKIGFSVPTSIDTETMRIWDLTNDHELDRSLFIPGSEFIRISASAIGDVLPGGSRAFDVYFLMEEFPGADPKEFHLDTEIFMGITPFLIVFLLGVGFIILGAVVAAWDKKNKDRWKVCVAMGIFIVVVIYILNMMGL